MRYLRDEPAGKRMGLWMGFAMLLGAISCSPVKPYQRAYLNDDAMQMGKTSLQKLSVNVHSYREAASGGAQGKGSGGCGCN